MKNTIRTLLGLGALCAFGLIATEEVREPGHVAAPMPVASVSAEVVRKRMPAEGPTWPGAAGNASVASDGIAADTAATTIAAVSATVVTPARDDLGETGRKAPDASAGKPDPTDKMSDQVAAIALAGGKQPVEVIVRYDTHPQLFDDERVAALGGEVVRGYGSLAMRAIRIPADALQSLAIEDSVDWLSLDARVMSFASAAQQTANVPDHTSANLPFSGSGVGVAIIDTGVSRHGDLAGNIRQYSFLNGAYPEPVLSQGLSISGLLTEPSIVDYNDSDREDLYGHGTHVAGIIAGAGVNSDGEHVGSSTGAHLLALQVLDNNGGGQMSDVMAALDWVLQYGSYFDIRVVNLSLGKPVSESNTTDPLVLAVEALWDAGYVVVVAAGNDGDAGNLTINSPGNSRKIITVGSLTDAGTGDDPTDDYVSSFSSRGPSVGDFVLKPDLVAPGNRITASIPPYSRLTRLLPGRASACKLSNCEDGYLQMSGTSMATPLVAAAVARMLQKEPGLTPSTVKARLMRSARKIDAEPTAVGAGVLDVDAALNDTGSVVGDALSPLMIRDPSGRGILIEDTGTLWGDSLWSAGYVFASGFNWTDAEAADVNGVIEASGFLWTDGGLGANGYLWTDGGVNANGFLWTDGDIWANGYLWSDEGGVWARGFLWTDETGARSVIEQIDEETAVIHDDP